MILPIVLYGSDILRQETVEITNDYPCINELINNMHETLTNAGGVGLAAPQVNLPIRLFIIQMNGEQKTFINPYIIYYDENMITNPEGCLSIPGVQENVKRSHKITMQYLDENFNEQEHTFTGFDSVVIQHEYDHVNGILFTDRLSKTRLRFLIKHLNNIRAGHIQPRYKTI